MAGSTGSSISSQLPVPQTREEGLQSLPSQDVYNVRFINHAPEPLQSPSFFQRGRIATNLQPSNGYAIKKSSGKSNFLLGSKRNNIFLQPTSIKWCQSRSKRYHCMYETPGCRSPQRHTNPYLVEHLPSEKETNFECLARGSMSFAKGWVIRLQASLARPLLCLPLARQYLYSSPLLFPSLAQQFLCSSPLLCLSLARQHLYSSLTLCVPIPQQFLPLCPSQLYSLPWF